MACSWLRICAEARIVLELGFACGIVPAECSCTRFAAWRTGCKYMHWWEEEREGAGLAPPRTLGDAARSTLAECSCKFMHWWEGEREGAGLAPPRTLGDAVSCMHRWEREREGAGLAPPRILGGAVLRSGGSQKAAEETKKFRVCPRKLPGRHRTLKESPK